MLWTHNLKNITYDDNFVPEGAPSNQSSKAITLGAGVQWHEAYDAAQSNGRIIAGGVSTGGTVGATGGWIQGGGHSALSSTYGLGVDNALQFTVVLASGKYVTVNEYQYSDLFWAIRGGGGGTFGVLVSATYQTHDILPVSGAFVLANFSTPQIAQDVITEYVSLHPNLSEVGWGGYSFYTQTGLQMLYIGTNVSLADANSTLSPFFAFLEETIGNPQDYQILLTNFTSFYDWYAFAVESVPVQVGYSQELVSRFLSQTMAAEQPEQVAEATLAVTDGVYFIFVAGGAVSQFDPDSAGVNPAWRESVGMYISSITWPEGTPTTEINTLRQTAAANLALLDPLAPNSATYLNEASLYEKNFTSTFFGSHYSSLKTIKRKYDVDDLFLVAEGVGSDDWDASLNCRLN
ncbi:hypothetical protein AX15_007930 [Amanita polypyramis BW_CC]|nr:hypothetical protein AX15_007930 [Amanita polypyramis BW_CC]